jgi:hypothetical protein
MLCDKQGGEELASSVSCSGSHLVVGAAGGFGATVGKLQLPDVLIDALNKYMNDDHNNFVFIHHILFLGHFP